jgi:hypothetical protein
VKKVVFTILTAALSYPLLSTAQDITFADSKVKAICVKFWDTNKDGELSQAEAAAVTTLDQEFHKKSEITSFDELSYFTGLTSIDNDEFYGCTSLTSISIPSSVTSIGRNAFYRCYELSQINFPEGLKSIGDNAFESCYALQDIPLPSQLTKLGNYAFYYCSKITNVTIPASVTSIGRNPFRGCYNITRLIVASDNPIYDSRDNSNTIIKTSSNALITGCRTTFIPQSVRSINSYAFEGCLGLKNIILPEGLVTIGESAFSRCTSLESIHIPSTVTSIGYRALSNTPQLASITVEEGNVWYDSRENCNAIIDKTNNSLIAGCKNSTVPEGIVRIGSYAFQQCTGLSSITLPSTLKTISNDAFASSGLTSIDLPEGLETIEEYAFSYCDALKTVTIPSTMKAITWYIFYESNNIIDVTSNIESPWGIFSTTFSNSTYQNATLHVPYGTKELYSTLEGWQEFANIVEGPSPYKLGDVNCDGWVSVTDAMMTVDYILGDEAADFHEDHADVNEDGEINVADVMAIVNIVLLQ